MSAVTVCLVSAHLIVAMFGKYQGEDEAAATPTPLTTIRRRVREIPLRATLSQEDTTALGTCFDITLMRQATQKSNAKHRYECRFCGCFDKFLESRQRALEHAMGMSIRGIIVKGCPAQGSSGATSGGIPTPVRNELRAAYNLPLYTSEEKQNKRKRPAAVLEDFQK